LSIRKKQVLFQEKEPNCSGTSRWPSVQEALQAWKAAAFVFDKDLISSR
jgi:hypothetical protein